MKKILLLSATVFFGACTVTTEVPRAVSIDSEKVVIYREGHRHGHDGHDKHQYRQKKGQHCPYGQAKKGRCRY